MRGGSAGGQAREWRLWSDQGWKQGAFGSGDGFMQVQSRGCGCDGRAGPIARRRGSVLGRWGLLGNSRNRPTTVARRGGHSQDWARGAVDPLGAHLDGTDAAVNGVDAATKAVAGLKDRDGVALGGQVDRGLEAGDAGADNDGAALRLGVGDGGSQCYCADECQDPTREGEGGPRHVYVGLRMFASEGRQGAFRRRIWRKLTANYGLNEQCYW